MTPFGYLLIILILVVVLDLGLLIWSRRNLDRRGISADDKRAVYLFNRYSPVLTWLKCSYLSLIEIPKRAIILTRSLLNRWGTDLKYLKDRKVKKEFRRKDTRQRNLVSAKEPSRIHIRFQIARNERVQITVESLSTTSHGDLLVSKNEMYPDTSISVQAGNAADEKLRSESTVLPVGVEVDGERDKKKPFKFRFFTKHQLATDFIVLSLALVPVILIVMDRWLKKPVAFLSLGDYWNKLASPLDLVYPAYFLVILVSILFIVILQLIAKVNNVDLSHREISRENFYPIISIDTHQRNLGRWILLASGICLVLAVFVYIRLGIVVGWWFLITLFLYSLGWLLREIPVQNMLALFKNNVSIIISFVVFYLSVVYLLAAINLNWHYLWVFLLIALLAFANVIRYHRRIHPILWSVPFFLILYTFRINGWEFSVIGDEYSFFEYAKYLATERSLGNIGSHIFDGQAVYGSHPLFSSFLQMIPMKLFGVNNFSWRISNIMLTSASIPLFYYFFRGYASQFIATATSLFIGASHYLMTFGKIGYNNLQAFFVLALVLSIANWTLKTRQRIRYVILGFCLAICFYVYPVALYIPLVWLIFMLFYNPPKTKEVARNWFAMGGMFLITIFPVLLQPDYWQSKVAGTLLNNPALLENIYSLSKQVISNLVYSFLSFLYIVDESHFVTVSYVDPITALLTLLGLSFALTRLRRDRFIAYMCISFVILLLLVGALHDRRFPPTTRMFMLLPWFVFFASIGLRWFYNLLTHLTVHPINTSIFLAAAIVVVVVLNLCQAYSLMVYRATRYQSPEALFLHLVQNMQTKSYVEKSLTRFLFLTDGTWDIDGYRKMQEVYEIPDSFVELDRYTVRGEPWPFSIERTIQDQNTLVIVYANLSQDYLTEITKNLSSLHKVACPVAAFDSSIRFYLWYSPQMSWVCEDVYNLTD